MLLVESFGALASADLVVVLTGTTTRPRVSASDAAKIAASFQTGRQPLMKKSGNGQWVVC